MSGLNVEGFNLFAKKPAANNKPAVKPIPVQASTPEVIEQEIKKFDAEIETVVEALEAAPEVIQNFSVEIERFEEMRSAPVQNTVTQKKPEIIQDRSIELTLRAPEKNKDEAALRKFETFVAPTFRIAEEHDLELKKIEHFIMRNRKKGHNTDSRERITTNSVVRAMLANFLERAGDLDFSNIDNEEVLKDRMEKIFKQKYTKRN